MLMLAGERHQRPYEAYMAVSNGLEVPMINWVSFMVESIEIGVQYPH